MTTYSITLDDLDLALLPRRTFTDDFLKRELFQFQATGAEAAGESVPTVYYKCHICAIQVPAAFASEHAASVKHRANARIASVAVERTRGLITAIPPPHSERRNGSFCANCSLIVVRNHTRSKQHRIAVNEDKMLWELMTVYVGDDADDDDKKGDDSESKLSDLEDLTISEERNAVTEIVDTKAINDYKQFKTEDSESELGDYENLTTSEKINEVTKIFDTIDHNDYKQFETDVVNGILPKRRKRTRPKKRGKKQLKELAEVEHTNEIDHQDVQNNDDNRVNETDHSNTNCEATSVEIELQTGSKITTDMKKTDSDLKDLTLIDEINDKTEISDTNELEEIEDDVNNSSATRENCNTNTQSKKMEPVDVQSDGNKGDENDNSNTNSENTSVTSETHTTSYEYCQCPSTYTNSEDLDLELTTDEIDIADTSYNKALEEIDNFNNTSETHEKCDDSTQLEKEHEVDEIDKQAHVQDKVDKDSDFDDINTTTETTVIETEKINSKIRYSIDACNKIRNDMELNERVPIIADTSESAQDRVYEDFVPDGNKFVRCLSDHYHDFIVKVGKVECKKFNCAFDCGEPLSRALSMRHTYPPMIDGSLFPPFIRKPEPTEDTGVRKLSETYSQCYVCKNVLRNENVATHILTARHQNKLKEAASAKNYSSVRETVTNEQLVEKTVEQNATTTKTENNLNTTVETRHDFEVNFEKWWKKIEDLILKQKIDKLKNEGLDKVETTADTTTAGSSGVSNNVEPKPGTSGLKLSIKYPYEATDKESIVRCVICDCFVPNTQDNRKGHLDGSNHAKNVGMNKPSFPYVATNQEAFVRCVVCNYNVPNDTQKKKGHLYGMTHANNAKKKEVSYPFEATKQESVLRCVVCDCKVPNTPENKEGHLAGSNHASNLKGKAYPYEATQQDGTVRCVVCDCKVPNTAENRKDHLLGSRHSSNMEAKKVRAS